MYYVNVNGKYYRFVDVPGNGNCFYYSVLRHRSLAQRFGKGDSMSLHQYLSSIVSTSTYSRGLRKATLRTNER